MGVIISRVSKGNYILRDHGYAGRNTVNFEGKKTRLRASTEIWMLAFLHI